MFWSFNNCFWNFFYVLLIIVCPFYLWINDGISMIIRQTILQLKTPDEVRGRVASVNSIFIGSSNELGAFESGLTARLMGTVPRSCFWRNNDCFFSCFYKF